MKRIVFFPIASIILLASCGSMVYDDLPECPPSGVLLPFRYDMNMKFADAFAHEVTALDLYIYDPEGNLVATKHEEGLPLRVEGYRMDLSGLQPGQYHFLAWAHGDNMPDTFSFSGQTSEPQLLHYTAKTEADQYGPYSRQDMRRLYHCSKDVTVPDYGNELITLPAMNLTKDTNTVRVLLQHIDGSPISHDDFNFAITENFTRLDHENRPSDFTQLTYRPWAKSTATAGNPEMAETSVSTLIAEMTTSRILTPEASIAHYNSFATKGSSPDRGHGNKPYLHVIKASDGSTAIRIPLSDYLLMVKGEYNKKMGDQEFLDRQDDYSLHFFLDHDNNWYMASGIYINSWKIVPQDCDL